MFVLKNKKKLAMNSVENKLYIYIEKDYIYISIHTHKYESILEMHCNGNKSRNDVCCCD